METELRINITIEKIRKYIDIFIYYVHTYVFRKFSLAVKLYLTAT